MRITFRAEMGKEICTRLLQEMEDAIMIIAELMDFPVVFTQFQLVCKPLCVLLPISINDFSLGASTPNGKHTGYSEPCTCIMLTIPGSDLHANGHRDWMVLSIKGFMLYAHKLVTIYACDAVLDYTNSI